MKACRADSNGFLLISIFLVSMVSVQGMFPSNAQIKYFGKNALGQSGRVDASPSLQIDENIMPFAVSDIRSMICSALISAVIYDNSSIEAFGQLSGWIEAPGAQKLATTHLGLYWSLDSASDLIGFGDNALTLLNTTAVDPVPSSDPVILNNRVGEDFRVCSPIFCLGFTYSPNLGSNGTPLWNYVGYFGDSQFGGGGMLPNGVGTFPSTLGDLEVKKASLGYGFTALLLDNGTVLTSGIDERIGRLSTPYYAFLPIEFNISIPNSQDIIITEVSTGVNTALLLSKDSRVFFFGINTDFNSGIPGFASTDIIRQASEIDFSTVLETGDRIRYISVAQLLPSAISEQGRIYIWGKYESNTGLVAIHLAPILYTNFFSAEDEFVVNYIGSDDITQTSHYTTNACVWTLPRSTNCAGKPPTLDYSCIGGIWTPRDPIVFIPSLTLNSSTIIGGSIVIKTVIFEGDAFISTSDCFEAETIEIVLADLDPTSIPPKHLISTKSSCKDISDTKISVLNPRDADKCKKTIATLERGENEGRVLYTAIFNANKSGCKSNLWWIVLVSIIGGIIIIVVVVVLLVSFVEPIKTKVRPFWIRSMQK